MEFSLLAQFILYRDFGVCAPRPYWTPRWCVMRWREPWGSTFGFPPGRYLHGGVECPQESLGVPHLGSLQAAFCTVLGNALKGVWGVPHWVPYSFKENKNKIKKALVFLKIDLFYIDFVQLCFSCLFLKILFWLS